MALSPFRENGEINWRAVLEQSALCRTIYADGVDRVLQVAQAAGGQTTEKAANRVRPDWTAFPNGKPVYVCWEQEGEYWVMIEGTWNATQWAANVFGGDQQAPLLGTQVGFYHRPWRNMAESMWAEIKPEVENDDKPINLFGHSLGGAVAWMIGCLSKQDFPTRAARVMTIASPRPMRGDYAGTKPDPSYDVQIGNDPIVRMPLNVLPLLPPWKQQGEIHVISTDGTLLASDFNSGDLLSLVNVSQWSLEHHWTQTYVNALLLYNVANVPEAANTKAVLVVAGLGNDQPNQVTQRGFAMSDFKRAVFQFKDREGYTWTEVLYGKNTASTLEDVKTQAADLLEKRCRMLADNIKIINAYVSDDDVIRDALYIDPPNPQAVDGADICWNKKLQADIAIQDGSDSDYAWTTLLLRMRSGQRCTKAMYISGIPDFTTVSRDARLKPAEMKEVFNKWKEEVVKNWAWKGIATTGDALPVKALKRVTIVDGKYQYETVEAHGLAVGNWVTISKSKGKGGNANGVQLVEAVVDANIFKGSKVATVGYQYLISGQSQKRGFGIFPIQEVFLRRFTSRKRGGSVALPRGRRRVKKS